MARSGRQTLFRKLAALYDRMQREYETASATLGLSCEGCGRNCCTSFFQHHTYLEWAYLWQGLKQLPEETRERYLHRAREYVDAARTARSFGNTPKLMCPLNDDGLCGLYTHRLMICRLHGVPNRLHLPNGHLLDFPGCWKSQELSESLDEIPVMDRTPLLRELAALEAELLGAKRGKLSKVDLTLAEMLVAGPPKLTR